MRHPAVAGRFYPGNEKELRAKIEECFLSPLGPGRLPEVVEGERRIVGAMVPHAGYMFSGPVAARVYDAIASDGLPEAFVLIGPNHTGMGGPVALSDEDFSTPLGVARSHPDIVKALGGIVQVDRLPHLNEHSVEVQVPFLQYLSEGVRIVPIVMGLQDEETARLLGEELRKVRREHDIVVMASSDMSHYVPKQVAERNDRAVLERIVALDVEGMYDVVRFRDVSMCGFGPVAAMLLSADVRDAELLGYSTSGDVMSMEEVVGYGAVVVKR